jgi:tripartite-type tricarboxylate transporter receptor subunit TctC
LHFGLRINASSCTMRRVETGERSRVPSLGGVLMRLFARAAGAALVLLLVAIGSAIAADYPVRTITLIVPYPPGGGVDAMARVVADKLTEALKQQVIVENRGGGGGTIGTRQAARAAPDGYTLLLGHTGTISINPSLYAKLGMDPRKDFAPVGLMATMPVALLANPAFEPRTIADVIALAKKDPGKLNVGTSAIGTGGYMCAELFKSEAGLNFAVIPYHGTSPVMTDLLGGHVPVAFGVLPPALGNIAAGKLRAIAVTSKKRFSLLPDVPTFAESGLPGFDAELHYGLLAPAGTPPEIIDKLSAALRKLVDTEAVQQRIHMEGGDPLASTPAEYADDIDREEKKWASLVHKLGLKVE